MAKDKFSGTGLDESFWPTQDAARDIFVLVYASLLGRGCQSTR
jgi:hypothetical protein